MAANTFDVSNVGNSTQITIGAGSPLSYFRAVIKYHFSTDGLNFFIVLNNDYYDCTVANLTVGGAAPANIAAALTTLSTLFK